MLAPVRWRRVASWVCGWLYVVGNITITLAVNFGTALFFIGCINVFDKGLDADGNPIPMIEGTSWQQFLIFLAITVLCNLVSSLGNKYLPWIDVRTSSHPPPAPAPSPHRTITDPAPGSVFRVSAPAFHSLSLFSFFYCSLRSKWASPFKQLAAACCASSSER